MLNATTRPRPGTPWDLIVVGGGTAGIVGAKTAARLGARVLLVERDRTGGDCLWTGCVPSKAILAAAAAAASARSAGRFGVHVTGVRVDFAEVMAHVRATIAHIAPIDSVAALESEGVRVVHGEAVFTDGSSVEVNGEKFTFGQALLAMGAAPAIPPIPGLRDAPHLTSDTIWDLAELPGRLVVLGGGSIGCELGQAFARLGAEVTIVEGAPRIMPREDAAAAALVAGALARDGVTVLAGSGVAAAEPGAGTAGQLVLADGVVVPYECLVVAVGRSPRTQGFGLAAAGVEVDKRGFVVVDAHLRTTNPMIWAAGDLTGHPQFTHTAGVHGSLAASNAVLGVRRKVALTAVPRVTFTHPEVAAVGLPTDPVQDGLRMIEWRHDRVDRAVAESDTDGITRLVVDRRSRILGATIVGPRAGETLGELTLAVKQGLRTQDLAGVIHPYPTFGDGPWNAALADVRESLDRPIVRRSLGLLAGIRRRAVARRGMNGAQRSER